MNKNPILLHTLVLFACVTLVSCAKPNEEQLVQAAIEHSYPDIYADLPDLRRDYPDFEPRVRQWSDDLVFLFGEGLYAVRMPEEEVLVTADGQVKTTRSCGSEGADCSIMAPKEPLMGVVGTVQLGLPDYPAADRLHVAWNGTPGSVLVVGHCFAAYKASAEPLELSLTVPGYDPIVIKNGHGYWLVAATADSEFNYYSSMRIPQSIFTASKECSETARETWPNVGGWAWKR